MYDNSVRSHVPNGYLVDYSQVLSTQETDEILVKCARALLDGLSPAGWEASGFFISGCFADGGLSRLCDYDPDVLDLTPSDVIIVRQVLAFFQKRTDYDLRTEAQRLRLKTADDAREEAAYLKFQEAERACKLTNACFRAWSQGRFQFDPDVENVLHVAQREIAETLGKAPSLSELRVRCGPGASTRVPKKNACTAVKLSSMPDCSANFSSLEEALASIFVTDQSTSDCGEWVDVSVSAASLSFVPKNAKIFRAICTEPLINSMFQLGLGDYIASVLKSVGIDITDQTRNQRAALYGSVSGFLATIDLSSASDTIAWLLIVHLFPDDWVELFRVFRTAECTYRKTGELFTLEKVSSMGNGFTFPLETLLFWALARACQKIAIPKSQRPVLAYGDDIIVETATVPLLLKAFKALGFTPNATKSFWEGGFRESCGKDFHFGINVRPVYVEGPLSGQDVFRLHNAFLERRRCDIAGCFWNVVHPSIRLLGPAGYGDGHLHVDDIFVPYEPAGRKKGWGGFTFESFTFEMNTLRREVAMHLAKVVKLKVPKWDPKSGNWTKTESVTDLLWNKRHDFAVRRIATYTQSLKRSDFVSELFQGLSHSSRPRGLVGYRIRARENAAHNCVYEWRNRAEPLPVDHMKHFVVPGTGELKRTKIYIFTSPAHL